MAARLFPVIPLIALGCGAAPEPREPLPPPVVTTVHYYAGTLLSGPRADPLEGFDTSTQTFAARCRVLHFEQLPERLLAPLASRAKLVVVPQGITAFKPNIELALRAQVGTGERALAFDRDLREGRLGGAKMIADLEGVLVPGVTAAFTVKDSAPMIVLGGESMHRRVAIHVAMARDLRPAVGLFVEGLVEDTLGGEEVARSAHTLPTAQSEYILLEEGPEVGGAPLILVVPSQFRKQDPSAFALVVTLQPPPTEAAPRAMYEERIARCLTSLEERGRAITGMTTELDPAQARLVEMGSAWRALPHARAPRAALVFLANATGASLGQDLAMVSDEETIALYVNRILEGHGNLDASDVPGIGWHLERTAYRLLAQYISQGELAPELLGILMRRAGQAAKSLHVLETGLGRCKDLASFHSFLVEENRLSLSDTTPAARVRAFDWLGARGLAPAGFEPTASLAECRAALAKTKAAGNQEADHR